jgi:hypothetical protein
MQPRESPHLVSPLLTLTQEWERCYLLTKARRLRDAADALAHSQAATATAVNSSQVAAYVASRVEAGAALPEVGVEGVQAEGGGQEGAAAAEGLVVREAVVRHVVEGLRGELVRELVGMVGV